MVGEKLGTLAVVKAATDGIQSRRRKSIGDTGRRAWIYVLQLQFLRQARKRGGSNTKSKYTKKKTSRNTLRSPLFFFTPASAAHAFLISTNENRTAPPPTVRAVQSSPQSIAVENPIVQDTRIHADRSGKPANRHATSEETILRR